MRNEPYEVPNEEEVDRAGERNVKVLMPRPQVTGVEMIGRSVHRRTVPKESDVLRSAHGVPMTANG